MNDSIAHFSQRDSRWGKITLGASPYNIRDWGCTITSTARICYLLTGKIYDPGVLAKKLGFTADGLLIWESMQRIGMKASRIRQNPSLDLIKANAGKMIIELNYSPRHWVAVEGVDIWGNIEVMDPLTGNLSKKKRSEITAYTLFEPTEPLPPVLSEYDKLVIEATKFVKDIGVSNGERPTEMVPRQELWIMLMRAIKHLEKK